MPNPATPTHANQTVNRLGHGAIRITPGAHGGVNSASAQFWVAIAILRRSVSE